HERPDQLFLGDSLDLEAGRELKAIEIAEREGDLLPRRIGVPADHLDGFPLAVVEAGLDPAVAFGGLARCLPVGTGVAGNAAAPLSADFGIDKETGFA